MTKLEQLKVLVRKWEREKSVTVAYEICEFLSKNLKGEEAMNKKEGIDAVWKKISEVRALAAANDIGLIALARDDKTGKAAQAIVGHDDDMLAMLCGIFMGLADEDTKKAEKLAYVVQLALKHNAVSISLAEEE